MTRANLGWMEMLTFNQTEAINYQRMDLKGSMSL
ncbi:uncharacterized protein METZ01_LOCUS430916 [marine metagenome]|uniref:Uncharacterized protein n=1 Tax=marine metagenome TaxID=408172 RepID=A0A382Y3Y5_9ZZZZ